MTTMWNDQILSFFEDANGKAINSTMSVWTWGSSPLFSSNINNYLLLSNWATWDNCEMVWKDADIFQRRFHGHCHCQIVRSLMILLKDDLPGLLPTGQVQLVSSTQQENPLVLEYWTRLFSSPVCTLKHTIAHVWIVVQVTWPFNSPCVAMGGSYSPWENTPIALQSFNFEDP